MSYVQTDWMITIYQMSKLGEKIFCFDGTLYFLVPGMNNVYYLTCSGGPWWINLTLGPIRDQQAGTQGTPPSIAQLGKEIDMSSNV